MGKFTTIATYSRFESMWNNNAIDNYSLYFIQDTGQLYAHGVLLSSVVFGTEASGAVPVTIAGITKSLALASHTHSNYIQNNQNIDLQTYKLVSGSNDLIYLSNGNIYVGNTSVPITVQSSTDLKSYRDTHEYTILDTGNFSIGNTTPTNYTLNNVAVFKYGSNTFQLDYVKRINASSTFDSLNSYTLAGTTQVNNKQYGIITLYTDGTTTNPSWAQLRINIPDRTVEYRTSSQTNNWIALSSQNIVQNALDQAGIVAAPSSQTANMVWKTDAQGNPAWREDPAGTDTWRNVRINDETSDRLNSDVTSGALYVKGGTGISVSWDNNKLLITNSSPNIWQAASDTQVGYVPSATKGKFLHCNATTGALEWIDDNNTWNAVSTTQAGYIPQIVTTGTLASSDSPFILVYKNLTGVTAPVWVPLPANAFNNTWQQNTATQAGYVTAPGANVSGKVWMTGSDGTPSWQDANNHTHSYLPLSGGTLSSSNNILTIKSSTSNSYIYFYSTINDTNTTRASVGYYANLAFIANESTYARIGVKDDGTPVYWNTANNSNEKILLHTGNVSPSLSVGTTDTNKIKVTVGNISSSEFTVPYATSANTASTANTASYANVWWTTSHRGTWYMSSDWDGSYFWLTGKYSSITYPAAVSYASSSGSANYANSAGVATGITGGFKSFNFGAGGSYIGWVSIAKLQLNTYNQYDYNSFNLYICRNYSSPSSESYAVNITIGWLKATIRLLGKSIGNQIINKCRIAIDSTNHILYLQAYVNTAYTTYTNSCTATLVGIVNNNWQADNTINNSLTNVTELDLTTGIQADYSVSAGNADTVDGYHEYSFAHIATANNLLCAGNEFNFISAGFSGGVWFNYQDENRGSAANISDYFFGNGRSGWSTMLHAGGYQTPTNSSVYALTSDGGHKHVTQLVNSGTASSFASLDITKTFIYINGNIGSYSAANR